MFRFMKSIAFACAVCLGGAAFAGEPAAEETGGKDPFATLLENQPVEVIRRGPSCSFIKIQLPEGVELGDIPGLQ